MLHKSQADLMERLNTRFAGRAAIDILRAVLAEKLLGKVAMVSSFGAESAVLLHMVAVIDRKTPIIFIDTELLFAETLVYQTELSERLGLRNLSIIRADNIDQIDPQNNLYKSDTQACCNLRKTLPLQRALKGYDAWITGRKRFQGGARQYLPLIEHDPQSGRLKCNPLAQWRAEDVQTYLDENRLPRHPLVEQGYGSIGCMPCTQPGDASRGGRWHGQEKTECGIHLLDGKFVSTARAEG